MESFSLSELHKNPNTKFHVIITVRSNSQHIDALCN